MEGGKRGTEKGKTREEGAVLIGVYCNKHFETIETTHTILSLILPNSCCEIVPFDATIDVVSLKDEMIELAFEKHKISTSSNTSQMFAQHVHSSFSNTKDVFVIALPSNLAQ